MIKEEFENCETASNYTKLHNQKRVQKRESITAMSVITATPINLSLTYTSYVINQNAYNLARY